PLLHHCVIRDATIHTDAKSDSLWMLSRAMGSLLFEVLAPILWPSEGLRRLWGLSRSRRAVSPRGEPLAWSRSQRFVATDQSREFELPSVARTVAVEVRQAG